MESTKDDQSLKPAPKASFKKRLYRFLTGKDGPQAQVNPQTESGEAAGAEARGGNNDGQSNSAYITVAAKNVPSNVIRDKDKHSISPESLLRFKAEMHPALRDQLSAHETIASTTRLEIAMPEDNAIQSFEAPSDAPRPASSVYSLSGETPSPVSSSSQRDQVSDESEERLSDEQDGKEQGAGPVLPELNFSLSMDDFSEVLDLVDKSKLVLVEQTNRKASNESATPSQSASVKTKEDLPLEPKRLGPAGGASSKTIQGNQTRQLGRIHLKSQGQPEAVKSRLFATINSEEGTKSGAAPRNPGPPYQGQLTERGSSPSSTEAVMDSDSPGNVSLEDESHPSPAHGSTGEGLEFSVAMSGPSKCAGRGPSPPVGKKPATAALTVRKPKAYLPHPGPEASKENTGTALPAPAVASAPAGDIAGDIAESRVHNPGTYPEASKSSPGSAPLTLEQWQEHFRILKQRSSAHSPASPPNPVHSPSLEQYSEPLISPQTSSSLRPPSPATYSAFPTPSTNTSSPTSFQARLDTPPGAPPTGLPPNPPTPRSSTGTPPQTPTFTAFESDISSKLRQVSLPINTSSPSIPSPTHPLAPAPTASKVAAKRRLFEQLPTIEERSPSKEENKNNQGNPTLAFTGTPRSSSAPSFIPDPIIRTPSRGGSPNTRQSTSTNNPLQGAVSSPRDHQPAAQLGAELPRYSSVEAATRSLDIIASRREQQKLASGNQDYRPGRRRRLPPSSLSTVTEEINSELRECAPTYGVEEEPTGQGQFAQQTRFFFYGAASTERTAAPSISTPVNSSLKHQNTSASTSANEVPLTIPALRSTKSSGDLPHSAATRSSAHSPLHPNAPATRTPKVIDRPRRSTDSTGSYTSANISSPPQYSSSPTVRSFAQEAHPTTPHLYRTDEMGQCLSKCCGERDEEEQVSTAVDEQLATTATPQSPARSPSRSPPGSPPRSAPIPIPPRARARDGGLLLTPTTGHPSKDRDREQHMRAGLRPSTGEGANQGGVFLAREDKSYSSSFADDELRSRSARSREPIYLPHPPTRPPPPPPCPAETTESVPADVDDTTMGSIAPSEVIASSTPRRTRAADPESASKSSSKGSDKSRTTRKSARSTKTAKASKPAKSVKSARSKSTPASIRSRSLLPPAAGHGRFFEANSESEEDRATRLAEWEEMRRVYQEKERVRKEQKLQKKASDRALRDAKREAKAAEGGPVLGADYAAAWESLRGALPFGKTKRSTSEPK